MKVSNPFGTGYACVVFSLLLPLDTDARTSARDAYGYSATDQGEPGGPAYQFLFIQDTGLKVVHPGDDISSASPVAAGGIGGPVQLVQPFPFYGEDLVELTPAANGYLSTDPTDLGLDRSNASNLPSPIPVGGGGRIYPLHDDLVISPGGGIYYDYLISPNHPHATIGGGCHVFQWDNVYLFGSPPDRIFDFEVLLFDNGDILYQYGLSADPKADAATIGIQNPAADDGLLYAADLTGALPPKPSGAAFFPSFAILIPAPLFVTDPSDAIPGPLGSLRDAMANVPDGGTIRIHPTLDGVDIQLSGELITPAGWDIKIIGREGQDSLRAARNARLFKVASNGALRLEGLVLIGGRAAGVAFPANSGGAILSDGRLSLFKVRIEDCHAEGDGGAVCGTALSDMFICDSTIERCSAVGRGGAGVSLAETGGHFRFVRATMVSCSAGQHGGGACDLRPGGLEFRASESTFRNCQAGSKGGAIFAQDSILALDSSEVIACVAAQDGGGIYAPGSSTNSMYLARSLITRCVAESGQGGGVFNGGEALIEGCSIFENRAGTDGGGIFNINRTELRYSSIYANIASRGAGVFNAGLSQMEINSATIAENTARTDGGGAFNAGNDLRLISTTLARNSAGSRGGGIRNEGWLFLAGTLVADNAARIAGPDLSGPLNARDGANLIGNSAGASDLTASELRDLDAKLGPLSRYGEGSYFSALGYALPNPPGFFTIPLLAGSPALDACPDLTALSKSVDQRGFPRLADGDGRASATEMDIGAWEARSPIIVNTKNDELNNSPPTSLREAIRDASVTHARITFDQNVFPDVTANDHTIALEPALGAILIENQTLSIDATEVNGVTLDGTGLFDILDMRANANLVLMGLALENAGAQALSAGNADETLTVFKCKFRRNGARLAPVSGAAIGFGRPTLTSKLATLRVLDSDFIENDASNLLIGGAILCDSDALFRGCRFEANTARSAGALALQHNRRVDVDRCTFLNNRSTHDGGAIQASFGIRLRIRNSTFSENWAGQFGGGVWSFGETSIANSTLNSNRARWGGAVLFFGTLTVSNSIIAGNDAPLDPDIAHSPGDIVQQVGRNLIGGDPKLAPLSDYGGGTLTMPPLAGSPALDAAAALDDLPAFDQRGFSRVVGSAPDLGAVEAGPLLVVNTRTDERDGSISDGDLSLRDAIAAATEPGTRIQFDPAVFAGPAAADNRILIDSSLGTIDITDRQIAIDATGVAGGVQLNAAGMRVGPNHQLIAILNKASLAMHQLEIREVLGSAILVSHGEAFTADRCTFVENSGEIAPLVGSTGPALWVEGRARVFQTHFLGNHTNIAGGAVSVSRHGSLSCRKCLFVGNEAPNGGALINFTDAPSRVELMDCAFVENRSEHNGGAIWALSQLQVSNSTFSGNQAGGAGGAVFHNKPAEFVTLTHCTLSANSAADEGGALAGGGPFVLDNSIVSGNTAPLDANIAQTATVIEVGNNIIGGDAFLAPLGDYGGPTPTMFPLPDSPAIDGAGPTSILPPFTDQRGIPRSIGIAPDLGAVETDTGLIDAIDADQDGMPKWWEDLFGLDDHDPNDALGDLDRDGSPNGDEFGNRTNPRDALDFLRIIEIRLIDRLDGLNRYRVTWTSWPGLQYLLEGSLDLKEPWTGLDAVEATGFTTTRTLAQPEPEFFTRVRRE